MATDALQGISVWFFRIFMVAFSQRANMECRADARFLTFYYFFYALVFIGGDVNYIIYVSDGARDGRYGFT